MNDKIACVFDRLPHIHLIFTEFGPGYMKATRDSVCPLTGLRVWANRSIRFVRAVSRAGATFEGYTSNDLIEFFEAISVPGLPGEGAETFTVSRAILAPSAALLRAASGGKILKNNGGIYPVTPGNRLQGGAAYMPPHQKITP